MSAAAVTHTAHELAAKALGWLNTHHELGGFPDDGGVSDMSDPNSVYKPLGETALAAAIVLREGVAGAAELSAARNLLEFAWGQMREGDLLYERQLQYGLMSDPLETYVQFVRGGYRHAALDVLLAHLASVGVTAEVHPNRRLAVANARRVVGVARSGDHHDDWPGMLSATWLGATAPPWAIDWMTGYSATHTVFHITDWGARPGDLPAHVADYLTKWLPVWIDVWSEVEQWDLVAELMIIGLCLPEPRYERAEWDRLAAVQHPDGMVPCDGQPVAEDPLERFQDNQHTTVVATIAGTLAVSRLLDRA